MGMGLLEKLMFWKEETTELDYDVKGCFTLPTDAENLDPGDAIADVASEVDGSITNSDC